MVQSGKPRQVGRMGVEGEDALVSAAMATGRLEDTVAVFTDVESSVADGSIVGSSLGGVEEGKNPFLFRGFRMGEF